VAWASARAAKAKSLPLLAYNTLREQFTTMGPLTSPAVLR
jgi:hypothetical protein